MYWNEQTGKWSTVPPRVPGQARKTPEPVKRWLTRWWGPEPHMKPYCTCAEGEDEGWEWYGHRWSRHDDTGACEALICDCTRYKPSTKQPPVYEDSEDEYEIDLGDRFDRFRQQSEAD